MELARRGIETVLLERSKGSGNPVGECLAPSANPLLCRLGVYDALLASGPLPSYGNRSAWGGDGMPADRDFLREPFGHGWHLDRPAFNAALLEVAAAAGVRVWRQARAVTFERADGCWQIGVETPNGARMLSATMLVDASGRGAAVARRQAVRRRSFDRQVAAVAVLSNDAATEAPHDATTVIEAEACGWWYAALLPDGRLSVAWFSDPDLLARSAVWRPAVWWERLGASELISKLIGAHGYGMPARVQTLAAGSALLTRPTGDGWIAAGDAAASYDPLSSHGIGSALAGGQQEARAVAAALAGDATAFSAYEDRLLAGYARYLWTRQAYYAEEHRWPESPFWARRIAGDTTMVPRDIPRDHLKA